MRRLGILTSSVLLLLPVGLPPAGGTGSTAPGGGGWDVTVVDPDQSFRGLDAVSRRVAWVSGGSTTGGAGAVFRTTDGGRTWNDVTPPGTEDLSLRDVEARNARTAVVLSIGEGEDSRIWRTTDGGTTWTETFRNTDEAAFYNCLDFYPGGRRGLAVSDPVDGRFQLIATHDRGRTWRELPDAGMPDSTGEFNFSASGDCLTIAGHTAWFGSGGSQARVFRSDDHGRTWTATASTLPADDAAGVFALAFRPAHPGVGVAVGGDFALPADGTDATAYTADGWSWTHGGDLTHLAEDASWLRGPRPVVVVVGEGLDADEVSQGGTSISTDGGRSWEVHSEEKFHTLDCTTDGACWAAGGGGRVGRW
jgi:photosystem II stability/assembly factor-like uncharacterized protein